MAIECNLSGILGTKRIKQAELARMTGLSPVTINQIFNDNWKQIGRDTLSKLCQALDCSVSDLLVYTPDSE